MTPLGYVVTVAAVALIPTVAIFATNVAVNPYDELENRWIPKPLVQVSRSEKVRLLQALPQPPEYMIFGSSRVMEVDPGARGFNMAVDSALPEDLLAQVVWLEDRNALPKHAAIGVDFDVFNPSIRTDARLRSTRFLYRLIEHIPEVRRLALRNDDGQLIPSFWRKYFSRQMLADSRKTIMANLRGMAPRSDHSANGLLVRRADLQQRQAVGWQADVSKDRIARYAAEKFVGYDSISADRLIVFERVLRQLTRKGTKVTLLLTPYHPEVLQYIRSEPVLRQRLTEVREVLSALSRRYGAGLADKTDLAAIPCTADEMWDLVHIMPECAARLARELRGRTDSPRVPTARAPSGHRP